MFLSTHSNGVRRLSLVAGLAAAGYYFATLSQPYGPPAQDPGRPWHNLFINLTNLAIEAGLYFLAAWLVVRIVAWVVAGFSSDRKLAQQAGAANMVHPSIADIPEDRLVEHLLAHPYWRDAVLSTHGIPDNPLDFQRVSLNDAPGGLQGDVDILVCAKDQPHLATAIEVKRVKVGAAAFRSGQPNKLQEYEKGVRQANLLSRVGFSQVYLFVLVVVDSREHNAGRTTYDGPTPELRAVIDNAIGPRDLDRRVGLIHHEFVQPMDYAPLGVGAGGKHLVRLAECAEQPAALTNWVAQLVARAA